MLLGGAGGATPSSVADGAGKERMHDNKANVGFLRLLGEKNKSPKVIEMTHLNLG